MNWPEWLETAPSKPLKLRRELKAYKELHEFRPSKLSDICDWGDYSPITYNYDGIHAPVIYHYLDGEKIGETAK